MNKRFFAAGLCLLLLLTGVTALGESMTLSFIGDCSIGEMYEAKGIARSYTATVDKYGMDWPFSQVVDVLAADDFTFANNEVVFTERSRRQNKKFCLRAAGTYAQVYNHSGIDAVNVANNHILDYLEAGYEDTLSALTAAGIPFFGTPKPDGDDLLDGLLIREVKGVRIGMLGYTYPLDGRVKMVTRRVAALKASGQCDLIVVSLHWGTEEKTTPSYWQYDFAKAVIDAGADVVWGHHPHVLQPVVFYEGKPIFFSTGNFTFGSMSDVDPDTGIFQLVYRVEEGQATLAQFQVIPCRTRGSGDYRPYMLTDEAEKRKMLRKLIARRQARGFENLPDSFADTGVYVLTMENAGNAE